MGNKIRVLVEKSQNSYEEMYDPKKVWPDESIKRYKEYLGKI